MHHSSPFDIEWLDPQLAPFLLAAIVLAVIGTAMLFCLGLVAYFRRRTTRYLLITIVLGLLVGRSMLGLGTVFGLLPMTIHHLVEHSVDFTIAVLLLYAVYRSGPTMDTQPSQPRVDSSVDESSSRSGDNEQ